MGNEVVGIDIVARLDQFRAELAKIPEIGGKEAKALTGQLSREIRQAERAAKEVGKSARDAKSGLDAMGASAGAVGSSAKKLRGILGQLSPDLANAAGLVDDIGDTFEVAAGAGEAAGLSLAGVGVALGAVAAAVGIGYLAWASYNEEGERAARISGEIAAAQEALEPILRSTRDAILDLDVATGRLTETEAEQERNSRRALDAHAKATEGATKRIKELTTAQSSLTTQIVDLVPAWTPLGVAMDGVTTSSAQMQEEIDGLRHTIDRATVATRDEAVVTSMVIAEKAAEKAKTEAQKRAKDALTEAIRRLNKAMDDEAAAAKRSADIYESAMGSLMGAEDRARTSQLEGVDKIVAARDAELAALEEHHRRAAAVTQEGTSARETLDAQYRASREAIIEASEVEITAFLRGEEEKRAKAAAEARRDRLEAEKAAALEIASAVGSIAGGVASAFDAIADDQVETVTQLEEHYARLEDRLTDAQKKDLQKRIKAQRDAARRSFEIAKTAKIAEAIIGTASAFVAALDDAPYPINLALAAVSAAAGTAQVLTISAQQPAFHSGGFPDEVPSVLTRGEAVLSPQGRRAFGDDAIRDANAGKAPAPQRIVAENHYGHRVFERFSLDHLRRGGPLTEAIRGDRRTGHREEP